MRDPTDEGWTDGRKEGGRSGLWYSGEWTEVSAVGREGRGRGHWDSWVDVGERIGRIVHGLAVLLVALTFETFNLTFTRYVTSFVLSHERKVLPAYLMVWYLKLF